MCRVAQNELKNKIIYHAHTPYEEVFRRLSSDEFFLLIFIDNATNDFYRSLYDVKSRHILYLIKNSNHHSLALLSE